MALTINGTTGIETNTDTGKLKLGADDDLRIYHDGSNSFIQNTTGNLIIEDDSGQIFLQSTVVSIESEDGETQAKFTADGAVELYHNNSKKFETLAGGAKVNSSAAATAEFGIQAASGQNAELWLLSDAGNQYGDKVRLLQDDGVLSTQFNTAADTWENAIKCTANGAVELYNDNSKKIETYGEGIRVTGFVKVQQDTDSHWDGNSYNWSMFQVNENGNCVVFENSHDSTPFGNYVYFSDAAPDDHSSYFMQCDDNSATRFKVWSDGDVYTHDANILTSDETLKENITDATSKLEDLKKLKVRNFNWKSSFHPEKSKKKQLGFIAQEVEQVFPALVEEYDVAPGAPNDGHTPVMKKAIKAAWDPIIIKAMQELIAKVETLETKVAALEAA